MDDNDSGSDDVLSIAPSDFSLVSDDQDARTSARDDQSVEDVPLDAKVSREEAKRSRHPVFSFEDDLVSLQVQDVMFTVHAHLFDSQSAQAFIERRRAAPGDGVIIVKDVSALDLERFLTILYSKSYAPARLHTKEEWTAVLVLAHRWDFPAIRAVAVAELAAVTTPIDKLVLARDYGVEEWLAGAYLAVCEAPEYPSDEDCLRLDRATIVKIGRAREACRSPRIRKLGPSSARADIIRRVFGLQHQSDGKVRRSVAPECTACAVQSSAGAVAVAVHVEDDSADPAPAPVPAIGPRRSRGTLSKPSSPNSDVSEPTVLRSLCWKFVGLGLSSPAWDPYKACGTHDELAAFHLALEAATKWFMGNNRSQDSCFVRLAVLEDEHRPFIERFRDLQDRASALEKLGDAIGVYFRRASSDDERDARVPASEMSRVSKLCLDTQRWMNGAGDDASAVTTEAILARLHELDELAQSVFD